MNQDNVALITGITGQDGSYLAEFLLEKGYRVVGLVRRSTHYGHPNIDHLTGRIKIEYGDLIDPDVLDSILARHRPDEVYHLAAQSVPALAAADCDGRDHSDCACSDHGGDASSRSRIQILPGHEP